MRNGLVIGYALGAILLLGFYFGSGSSAESNLAVSAPVGATVAPTRILAPTSTPIPTPTHCPIEFTDVPPGNPFYSFVQCLACLGAIGGYPDGSFRPHIETTRGQLCK